MNTSFVPTLHHLTCSRLVLSLFNQVEVQKNFRRKNYRRIKSEVTEAISQLTPCTRLQEKLEQFIDPLFREIEDWIRIFENNWYGYDGVYRCILDTLPPCWLSDGTIDRELSVKSLLKNEDLRPLNRFIYACTYCLFDDVLDLWEVLFKIEKAYLRHKSAPLVKHWVEWLESSANKDRESFIAWTLETPLWKSNVYILKYTLGTLSQEEKSQYLLKALIGKEAPPDVVRFCISAVTKDEQELIFRECPVEVFRCISSWPLQSIFYDVVDNLQPYLTEETFCSILEMIFVRIKSPGRPCVPLIEILQTFWTQSPRQFQDYAKDDPRISKPLQFLLNFDITEEFSKQKFLDCFLTDVPNNLPVPQALAEHHHQRVRRRYRNML